MPWLLSAGGSVDNLTSDESKESMTYLKDLMDKGYISKECINWTQADAEKQFASGQAAMMINGPWQFSGLSDDAPDLEYGVAKVPKADDGDYASVLGGENVAICKGANVEASWKFLTWITSKEESAKICEAIGRYSPRADVDVQEMYKDDPLNATFAEILPTAESRGPSPVWPEISEAIYSAEQEVLSGQKDVEAAIRATDIEEMSINNTDKGITFEVDQSGFSPFALVWQGEKSEGGGDGSSSSGGGHTSNTYYVRYHNDDDTVKDGKFIPGETVTVKGNVFTAPVGKVLAGWSLEEDGKVDYKVGDTFRMPGSSVDLYAVWKDAETESHSAYISGYPDGTVGPDKTITRAEAATMFYNLLADKNGDTKAFTDVPANQWYAKAVMTLAGKGVISGYPDGTFKPNASITRAEFVTMAMNFANAGKGTACSFPDVPQNMWYYGAIAGATQNGWISGYPDGTFGPDRYITRAEVTSVINRMENRAADMSFMMEHLKELRTFSDLSFGHWAYGSMMEAANGHDYTRADQNSYESWVDIH